MENILVTGGLGFIGLHLLSKLSADGNIFIHNVDYNSLDENYFETFAPTIKRSTLRWMLATACALGIPVFESDVETAFLMSDLDEEDDVDLYMWQPKGYEKFGANGERLVCKLAASLYGSKQAGRNWYLLFKRIIMAFRAKGAEATMEMCDQDNCFVLHSASLLVSPVPKLRQPSANVRGGSGPPILNEWLPLLNSQPL